MDDKNTKTNNPNGSNDKPFDSLTKKAQEQSAEFGAAGHDDINKNLGSFGNVQVQPQQAPAPEVKLDVDAKVVEKAAQEKINFERFSRTRRTEKAAKTKFGEKVSIMLRTKKGLTLTWVIEMLVMVIIIAISAVFIAILSKYKGASGEGPLILPEVQKPLKVGLVFAWISLWPCLIPLIYLITTWFIGINEVAKSRIYHFMFWICGAIALICFIVAIGCLAMPMHWASVYPPKI